MNPSVHVRASLYFRINKQTIHTTMTEADGDVKTSTMSPWYAVKCHCGQVHGQFRLPPSSTTRLIAWDCNCSDCWMRRNIHTIVPQTDFQYVPSQQAWEDATTLYQWGTKTAIRRFCKTCGILPWYTPRSNPDGVAITLNCIDWGNDPKPDIVMQTFDGIHWEESMARLDEDTLEEAVRISAQSKPRTPIDP